MAVSVIYGIPLSNCMLCVVFGSLVTVLQKMWVFPVGVKWLIGCKNLVLDQDYVPYSHLQY